MFDVILLLMRYIN